MYNLKLQNGYEGQHNVVAIYYIFMRRALTITTT